jgi:GNAT superfamily N-acetyltransferase
MSAQIQIQECKTAAERLRFIQFWWEPYKRNPYWVPPLVNERQEFLDPAKNPFFQHGRAAYFLATRQGEPVGTIGAHVNDQHNQFHGENIGFFGFFECVNDYAVAEALFKTASDWCKSQGVSAMRGPASFSSNDDGYGFLLDGFDDSPRVLMSYTPPYYVEFAERFGFRKAMDLYAYALDVASFGSQVDKLSSKLARIVPKIRERLGLTIRTVDMSRFDEEVARVKSVYNSAWERNWGFVPMTEAEFDHLAKGMKDILDPRVVFIAEKEGKFVGFSLSLPDVNQALLAAHPSPNPNPLVYNLMLARMMWHWKVAKKVNWLRVFAMGVVEEYRSIGIAPIFYYETAKAAIPAGYTHGEMSWILENNVMMNRDIQTLGGTVYKTYRLVEKPL